MGSRALARGPIAGRREGSPMATSQNTTVDLTIPGTSFMGLSTYGNVMVGDHAFEFYNEHNPEDFIQIPWDEVDYVAASVMFGGKVIPRFAIFTKSNGHFSFSTRDNKRTLRAIRTYVPADHLVRSLTFFDVIKKGLGRIFHRS